MGEKSSSTPSATVASQGSSKESASRDSRHRSNTADAGPVELVARDEIMRQIFGDVGELIEGTCH